MNARRSFLATASLAVVMTACGASAPPGSELADELIETLDVTDEARACMRSVIENFTLSEQDSQGFSDLDDVFQKATEDQPRAKELVAEVRADLEACT